MTRNATLLRAARVRAAKSGRCTSCRYGTPRDGLHTCDRWHSTHQAALTVSCFAARRLLRAVRSRQRGDGAHRFGCVARRAA